MQYAAHIQGYQINEETTAQHESIKWSKRKCLYKCFPYQMFPYGWQCEDIAWILYYVSDTTLKKYQKLTNYQLYKQSSDLKTFCRQKFFRILTWNSTKVGNTDPSYIRQNFMFGKYPIIFPTFHNPLLSNKATYVPFNNEWMVLATLNFLLNNCSKCTYLVHRADS